MTGLALKHMLENSFSEAEGARPIGLVFTDGRSQDDITEFAKMPKEAGKTRALRGSTHNPRCVLWICQLMSCCR